MGTMRTSRTRLQVLVLTACGIATGTTVLGEESGTQTASAGESPSTSHTADSSSDLATVQVAGRIPDWDRKKYRNLLRAMRIFDESRIARAPQAVMRFKVFPRYDEAVMQGLALTLWGKTVKRPIALAADGTFTVDMDTIAQEENALVVSNRRNNSLAWRADIRTPGLPPNTRRLGDLRLECKVDATGTGADLATSIKPPAFWALAAVVDDPCMVRGVSYAWFADEPVFSVTLVSGSRRHTLRCVSVWGCHAPPLFNTMDWRDHLRDRMFWLPIWDDTWPDDTLVVLEPMRGIGTSGGRDAKP